MKDIFLVSVFLTTFSLFATTGKIEVLNKSSGFIIEGEELEFVLNPKFATAGLAPNQVKKTNEVETNVVIYMESILESKRVKPIEFKKDKKTGYYNAKILVPLLTKGQAYKLTGSHLAKPRGHVIIPSSSYFIFKK